VNDYTHQPPPDFGDKKRGGFKKAILIFVAVIAVLVILFFTFILSLRWVNPPVTAFTLQEDWQELEMERYNLRDYWVQTDDLPEHLKWAVIASEDQRFYEHRGIDWEAVDEALEERRSGERVRGASTITQQVAKNLYLWPAQSFFRKGIEAGIALTIDFMWPKERILEVYLNIAEFGPGIFGVGMAAEHFYGVHTSEIEPESSAIFAAVLPNPKRMRVEPPSPFAEERSHWILRQMTMITGTPYVDITVTDPGRLFIETQQFFETLYGDRMSELEQVERAGELEEEDWPEPDLQIELEPIPLDTLLLEND